jgi:predicted ATP-binding protein involved in virulence
MRLDEVTIGEFKNLRDLSVDFDESSSYTVLVGENGAGKSNLIEALSLIFRNLDLDLEAPFSYHLKYQCREYDVEVRATRRSLSPILGQAPFRDGGISRTAAQTLHGPGCGRSPAL